MGAKNENSAKVQTPIEAVILNERGLRHLIEDNNPERLQDLNKITATLERPNLIIQTEKERVKRNNYIKAFTDGTKDKAHLQIIECTENGNFYVTNFRLKNSKLESLLKQGQVVYDLSQTTASVQKSTSVNTSITKNNTDFNPDESNKTSGLEQIAPNNVKKAREKKQGKTEGADNTKKKKIKLPKIKDNGDVVANYGKVASRYVTNGEILYDNNYFDFDREVSDYEPDYKPKGYSNFGQMIIENAAKNNIPLTEPKEITANRGGKIISLKAGGKTVAIDKKYYDKIKEFSLYSNGDPHDKIAIKNSNGDTVGVVMPISDGGKPSNIHYQSADEGNGKSVNSGKTENKTRSIGENSINNKQDLVNKYYEQCKNTKMTMNRLKKAVRLYRK